MYTVQLSGYPLIQDSLRRRCKDNQQERPSRGRDKKQEDDDHDEDDESGDHEFQKATKAMCVDGGASLHTSHRQLKQWAREITAAEPSFDAQKPLKWSSTPLIFDAEDHPDRTTAVGCVPLLVSPIIRNLKVNKMLVDGGAGLNLISPVVVKRLYIPDGDLEETGTFQGVNPGRSQPKGKVTLLVTFVIELDYMTERIVFDVAEIPLPYNGILGRPALAKFMAASHYAYNTLKMPGPMTIITVPSDKKDALICADQLYREAVAATAAKALAPAARAPAGKKTGKTSRTHSGKLTSSEYCATIENVPESSTGRNKKPRAIPPGTKKVSVNEDDMGGAFTISSTLDDK